MKVRRIRSTTVHNFRALHSGESRDLARFWQEFCWGFASGFREPPTRDAYATQDRLGCQAWSAWPSKQVTHGLRTMCIRVATLASASNRTDYLLQPLGGINPGGASPGGPSRIDPLRDRCEPDLQRMGEGLRGPCVLQTAACTSADAAALLAAHASRGS